MLLQYIYAIIVCMCVCVCGLSVIVELPYVRGGINSEVVTIKHKFGYSWHSKTSLFWTVVLSIVRGRIQ